MQKFVKMDDSIINSISEQIIRPCFLNDCVYSTKTTILITPEYNNLLEIVFSVKLKCDSNFNLYELLKWIKYILLKYNNMITFINWDDTKEFDFQTDYDTFLYFKIENFHNFLLLPLNVPANGLLKVFPPPLFPLLSCLISRHHTVLPPAVPMLYSFFRVIHLIN